MSITEAVTAAADVAKHVAFSLPPAFLAMIAVNVVFLLGLLWIMHDLQIARIEAITKIFATCANALIDDAKRAAP
jgi:hypothetical protein